PARQEGDCDRLRAVWGSRPAAQSRVADSAQPAERHDYALRAVWLRELFIDRHPDRRSGRHGARKAVRCSPAWIACHARWDDRQLHDGLYRRCLGVGRLAIVAQARSTTTTRTSQTLVWVGPVLIRPLSGLKKR